MRTNVIISGGIFHPFDESSEALASLLREVGIESDIVGDVDAGIGLLSDRKADMVTINALRWGMMTADKYEPYRAEWAYRMPRSSRDKLTAFVSSGGALLGMHTASICFDDWPEWGELLGGCWQWGTSHHPPVGPVSARPTGYAHAVTKDIQPFELNDEIYHDLALEADVEPLLVGTCEACEGSQPICWARSFGNGRVVYDALGHDAASIEHPQHRKLLVQAAMWLLEGRQ